MADGDVSVGADGDDGRQGRVPADVTEDAHGRVKGIAQKSSAPDGARRRVEKEQEEHDRVADSQREDQRVEGVVELAATLESDVEDQGVEEDADRRQSRHANGRQ